MLQMSKVYNEANKNIEIRIFTFSFFYFKSGRCVAPLLYFTNNIYLLIMTLL